MGDATTLTPLWPGQMRSLDGYTLHLREAKSTGAQAEPALMVHGLGGSSTNWTDLMAHLNDELEIVAPDLPGFGVSEMPADDDLSPAGHARAMAAVIEDRFDGKPVHVFGNSLGGAVSLQLAARRPELVKSLTLVSPALPSFRLRRTNAQVPLVTVPGIGAQVMRRFAGVDPQRRAQAMIDLCYHDPSSVPPERLAEAAAAIAERDQIPWTTDAFVKSSRGLIRTFLDRGSESPWQLAKRVDVPTLLIYGRSDKLVDPAQAHVATKHFPDASVIVLPKAGHVAQMEHPQTVAAAWRDLIAPKTAPRSAAGDA